MKKITLIKLTLSILGLLAGIVLSAQISDSFTDGDFTANPVWSGDTGSWIVKNNSSASTGATGSKTLRLKVASGSGTEYLSTPYSNWGTSQVWSFFLGRRNNIYSNNNKVYIWLYANEANLESATVDGYRIRIGQTGADQIHLEKVTDGVGTTFLSSPTISASKDFGLDIVVERTVTGGWILKSSVLPVNNGEGVVASEDPLTTAIINHGSAVETTYTPTGSAYMGIVGHHGSSLSARKAIEFDQFSLTVSSNNTYVEFNTPINSSSNESSGMVNLPISILFENATTATTVDVVLISGDPARINNYSTQTVTFPAGSSAIQFLPITITDNSLCDGNEELIFELQNITGGTSPSIGIQNKHYLTINDNEKGSVVLKYDDLEDEDIDLWYQAGTSSWSITNNGAITDDFSLRHVNNGASGISSVTTPIDNASLRSVSTTWQFNFNYYGNNPSPNNNFLMYLSANESDLTSPTVDGYAVGVRPASSAAPDLITLWKIVDGVTTTAIITSNYNLGSSDYKMGIRVTRDEFGVWELLIDNNGGFDNLISEGVGTNTDYLDISFFGVYFKYTSSRGGKLAIDDISLHQEGCSYTYYSQSSGNVDDPIWADVPVGTSQVVRFNRFTTLVIQSSNVINMNVDVDAKDLIIESGGIWNAGVEKLRMYGSFYNDGAFIPGTSTLFLCGNSSQELGGSVISKFYDLVMSNIGGDVLQIGDVEMINVFSPIHGEYDTDGYGFTLLSDVSKTGSISTFGDSDFYGEITMQRYIPNDAVVDGYPGGWVRIGNSLTGATLNSWNDDIITTGFSGADYEYSEYPFVNIFSYDETNISADGVGWVPATDINNPLSTSLGYAVYMLGDAQLIDVTGDFQRGSITQNLDYTDTGDAINDGWNLVVNPYPSEIDFNKLYNYSNGVTSYSVWDTETGSYLVYNASTGMGSGSRYVPSSQPMWIQATAVGQYLQYEEDIKSSTDVSFERDNMTIEQVEISINQDNYQDRTFLGFNGNATDGFDTSYDLRKIDKTPEENGLPLTISSIAITEKMSINVLPLITENTSIPLFISVKTPGEVSIVIENTLGLPESSCLILEDLVLNETHQLIQGESFSFNVDEPYEGNRFIIHVGAPIQIVKEDITCNGDANGSIVAQGLGEGPFDYTWYNEDGIVIFEDNNVYGSSSLEGLTLGNYTIEVGSSNGLCGTISEMIYIDQPQEQTITWSIDPDYCYDNNPGVIVVESDTNIPFEYEIKDENDVLVLAGSSEVAIAEELNSGLYQVTIITNCNLYQFQADLTDPDFVNVDIEESETFVSLVDDEVIVDFDADFTNQGIISWTINNEVVSTEESFSHVFTEVGDYYVVAFIENENGCYSSDEQIVHVSNVLAVEEISNTSATMILHDQNVEIIFDSTIRKSQFEIYNMLGQVVITHPIQIEEKTVINEDISSLSNGAYVVRILSNNENIFSRKFIK